MEFLALLMVALMPVLKTLLLTGVGLILAIDRVKLLGPTARHNLNNMVFYIFTPCLMGAYLAKTVTFDVMVNMWFMPVNILITFILGSALGWILVKITKAPYNLQGLVIGCCAAGIFLTGNLGNLMLIIIPAICNEPKNPFGEYSICMADGAAYVSVSMAVGAIYIWSYVYVIMKISAEKSIRSSERSDTNYAVVNIRAPEATSEVSQPLLLSKVGGTVSVLEKIKKGLNGFVRRIRTVNLQMLLAPTTIGSAIGFVIGVVPLLKSLLVGNEAPLRIFFSASEILGGATVPCVTLIVGANLLRGLRRSGISAVLIIGIIVVRYIALPLLGIVIVRAAKHFGLVGSNPLYQFVLMLQFALPPAMSIGTITQLFEAGEGECSVVMLWTYAMSALALTLWSTFFMWLVL